jgi:27-O-demethylrifamycin SV methyltransferase
MQLGFADSSFDCIWVMESSHLMQDKPALLAECARVLRPRGRLVLCDIMAKRSLEMEDVIAYRDEFLLLQAVFGRARMEPLARYRAMLEDLGFTVTGAEDISAHTQATFSRWRDNALENRAEVVRLLGETAWREFLDSCLVLERLWDQGVLGYGLVAAVKPAGT